MLHDQEITNHRRDKKKISDCFVDSIGKEPEVSVMSLRLPLDITNCRTLNGVTLAK